VGVNVSNADCRNRFLHPTIARTAWGSRAAAGITWPSTLAVGLLNFLSSPTQVIQPGTSGLSLTCPQFRRVGHAKFARRCRKEKGLRFGLRIGALGINSGGDLRSHTVTRAVSSALRGLTSVFGMGTGVTPAVWPPENLKPACTFIAGSVREPRDKNASKLETRKCGFGENRNHRVSQLK
jgi:hypothetical protein